MQMQSLNFAVLFSARDFYSWLMRWLGRSPNRKRHVGELRSCTKQRAEVRQKMETRLQTIGEGLSCSFWLATVFRVSIIWSQCNRIWRVRFQAGKLLAIDLQSFLPARFASRTLEFLHVVWPVFDMDLWTAGLWVSCGWRWPCARKLRRSCGSSRLVAHSMALRWGWGSHGMLMYVMIDYDCIWLYMYVLLISNLLASRPFAESIGMWSASLSVLAVFLQAATAAGSGLHP